MDEGGAHFRALRRAIVFFVCAGAIIAAIARFATN